MQPIDQQRRTKIVATIGPACQSPELLGQLIDQGVDLFRLNFSHGDNREKAALISTIREVAAASGRVVALLGDLQGPKIRVGKLPSGQLMLTRGMAVILRPQTEPGQGNLVPVTYEHLPQDVEPGQRLLLDDGRLLLRVQKVQGDEVHCQVMAGGLLRDHKGINLPESRLSTPALTPKDYADIDFAIAEQLDFLALSFVRQPEDVELLATYLAERQAPIKLIAKIDKPEAVASFRAILQASDGIMIARGDLGVEMRPESVPLIQKQLIRQCNLAGKPVITATQMLESMIERPVPTRAETSDVANAILDGTDAVMLSGETAVGRYPVEAVAVLDRIASEIDEQMLAEKGCQPLPAGALRSLPEGIAEAACRAAVAVRAAAIIAFTQTGYSAALVAKQRPTAPILAVTPSTRVQRQLCLYHGVSTLFVSIQGNTEAQIEAVESTILEHNILEPGETVIIIMGSPLSAPGTTNLMKIHRLRQSG